MLAQTDNWRNLLWFAALAALAALLVALVPPEKTLGWIIRPVFLHGALVQAGLIAFAAAGLLGLLYFVQRSTRVIAWCLAAQETAVLLWIAYALSSMVTTRLAWGEWIAWDEPHVPRKHSRAVVLSRLPAARALDRAPSLYRPDQRCRRWRHLVSD